MNILKPKDIAAQTGWSLYRVLKLINQGRIPATNSGTGSTPRWEVRQCDLDAFFVPATQVKPLQSPSRRKPRLTPEEMKIAAELMAMAHGRVTTPEPAKTARKAKRSPELERAIASILEKV